MLPRIILQTIKVSFTATLQLSNLLLNPLFSDDCKDRRDKQFCMSLKKSGECYKDHEATRMQCPVTCGYCRKFHFLLLLLFVRLFNIHIFL